MHLQHDVVLQEILGDPSALLLSELGISIAQWLNVDLQDLHLSTGPLGLDSDGNLIHIDIQLTNDTETPYRIAEYALRVHRRFKRLPQQILLYCGRAKLRMPAKVQTEEMQYWYRAVDIRSLDGERLAASANINENILAILLRLRDQQELVRSIQRKMATLEPGERERAYVRLLVLAGLRNLEDLVNAEVGKMVDLAKIIRENKVLGPEFKRNRQEGRQEGRVVMLHRQIEARFGSLPAWGLEKLSALSEAELDEVAVRLLSANDLNELLRSEPAVHSRSLRRHVSRPTSLGLPS